ncbi:hypothetical protein [Sphingomonas aerolata]|uniref:hypothetical protein n=1 Tax=Sphingomonas aerolata TaxID=185951 RepID=UPI002FE3BC65
MAFSQFSSLSQFIRVSPYFKTKLSDGNERYVPSGFAYGDEAFQYKRYGIYGAAQWQPAESLTFTGSFFQSRYKSQSSDYGTQLDSADSGGRSGEQLVRQQRPAYQDERALQPRHGDVCPDGWVGQQQRQQGVRREQHADARLFAVVRLGTHRQPCVAEGIAPARRFAAGL